jgi:hypothetical protein
MRCRHCWPGKLRKLSENFSREFILATLNSLDSLEVMKTANYIPPSLQEAEIQLSIARKKGLENLEKEEFVRSWCSLLFLYPGLHPDGFTSRGSEWPRQLKPFAKEAWRRFEVGALTDDEFYYYQACKARIALERTDALRTTPWLLTDQLCA